MISLCPSNPALLLNSSSVQTLHKRHLIKRESIVAMDRGVSYYGPLFTTTPAPGSKDDEERTPLLTQLPSAEVLANVRRYNGSFLKYLSDVVAVLD
jgi:hypothetical protein